MATLDLTAGAPPIFLSKNYVNRESKSNSDLTVSTGDAFKHRLYDFVTTTQWTSVGSDDTATETITVGLYNGAAQVSRTIDLIALININLKNFKVEYSNDNGATYTTVSGTDYTSSNFTSSHLVVNIAAGITANKLKITMTTTQTANQQKSIGEFVAALSTFQAPRMVIYDPRRIENRKEVRMADGSLDYTYFRRGDGGIEFYRAKVGWRNITTAQRTNFRTVKTGEDPFIWYPEPGDVKDDIFQCLITPGSWHDNYSTKFKNGGYDVNFEIEEIGGA